MWGSFAKFLGYLAPGCGEGNYSDPSKRRRESLVYHESIAQLVGIAIIALLTAINSRGVEGW
jgi:hypothetical protein